MSMAMKVNDNKLYHVLYARVCGKKDIIIEENDREYRAIIIYILKLLLVKTIIWFILSLIDIFVRIIKQITKTVFTTTSVV